MEKNYNKTKLKNGLVIVSDFVPNIGSFAAGVCINTGARNDYKNKEGIAHFMEHSAFRRTKNRTSKQIANEFENLGAYSNAWTTKDITCYYVRAITHNFDKAFELLSDISQNTIFVNDEIEKERSIIIEEIKSYEDEPEEYITDLIDSLVFANTDLAHPIVGSQQSVSNISISDLQKFHNQFYIPSNMLVAVAGNVEHNDIVKLAENLFNKNKNNSVTKSKSKNKKIISTNSQQITISKPIQQAHLMLGTITDGYSNKVNPNERYKLAIANTIFGDGMSSRLYQTLREKHGLAYSIYSSIQNYIDCGQINIYAATDKNNLEKTIDLIYKQMNLLNNSKKPTKNEINRAKEQLKTATIIELESMAARANNIIKHELCIGYNEDIETIIKNIEKITIDDIVEINVKYFSADNWCKCVLEPSFK